MTVSFGDNVRILPSPATDAAGISGLSGRICGETVPSASGVSALGELSDDYAVNVFVEELSRDFWLDPSLVEFIDHGAGAKITIAGPPVKPGLAPLGNLWPAWGGRSCFWLRGR